MTQFSRINVDRSGSPTPRNLVSCWGRRLAVAATLQLRLLGQEGSVDGSFQSPKYDLPVPFIRVEADGKVLCLHSSDGIHFAISRLSSTGSPDSPVNLGDGPQLITPPIDIGTIHIPGSTNAGTIAVLHPLPNGQFLVGGSFSHFNKVARKLLVRMNSDGSVDTSFNQGAGFEGDNVTCLMTAPGGKIYAGGKFTKFSGSARNVGIVRLNADGSLDDSFGDSTVSFGATVADFSLQPDGKPLVNAAYANASFQATLQVYRLGVNGGLDSTFAQGAGTPASTAGLRYVVMPNGQLLLSGSTGSYNGANVNKAMFRLNSDGTLDTSYPGLTLSFVNIGGLIGRFLPTPSGAVYISGAFDKVDGQPRSGLARLKADGTLDPAFSPAAYVSPSPGALALQPDGKILVCSSLFTGGQVKYNIVRLNASGTVQPPEGARIGALTFLPNGVVQVQVTGGTPNVVIEASADLKTWQTLGTGTVTGGLLTFTDPLAGTSKARFFRLVAAP